MFTSDVPQVLQKRAAAVLLAPHLGHVTTDIGYETNLFLRQLLGLTFEYVCLGSATHDPPVRTPYGADFLIVRAIQGFLIFDLQLPNYFDEIVGEEDQLDRFLLRNVALGVV
jgi:hypothetical protein